MSRMKTAVAAATLGLFAASSPLWATSFVGKQSAGEMSTSGLRGAKVQNPAGDVVGDVNYFVIDSAGAVTTVVIGVGGFVGVGEKNVGIAFKDLQRKQDDKGNEVFVLDTTKDELNAAPAYAWTEKTAMDKIKSEASELADKAKQVSKDLTEKAKDSMKSEPKATDPAPN